MKISNEELITKGELADRLKISLETVSRWKRDGMPFIQLTDKVARFQLNEVIKWRAEVMAAKKKGGVGIGKK